jgi:hypothetical protein
MVWCYSDIFRHLVIIGFLYRYFSTLKHSIVFIDELTSLPSDINERRICLTIIYKNYQTLSILIYTSCAICCNNITSLLLHLLLLWRQNQNNNYL